MIEFKPVGTNWQLNGNLRGLSHLQLTSLLIALQELEAEVKRHINARSAETQLHEEIGRRMQHLNARANAAGMQQEMWVKTTSRFYKEREVIEGMKNDPHHQ